MALAERRGIGWCVQCVRDVQDRWVSRNEQLVRYLLMYPVKAWPAV